MNPAYQVQEVEFALQKVSSFLFSLIMFSFFKFLDTETHAYV